MRSLKFPNWAKTHNYKFESFNEIPDSVLQSIKLNINNNCNSKSYVDVTIIIPVWNEEKHILKSLSSLSQQNTTYSYEIIVVNNNSTDNTQKILNILNIKNIFQRKQGHGVARQTGLQNARGKYILLADADTIYPHTWINEMIKNLKQLNVTCVYGRYSFIPDVNQSRVWLYLYELTKDLIAELKHYKRPHLNAYGMNMGFIKKWGIKFGFDKRNVRLDDGIMAINLNSIGKIKYSRSNKTLCWTVQRTINKDGTLFNAFLKRVNKERKLFFKYFTQQKSH